MSAVLLIDDDAVLLKALVEALKRGHRNIQIETATTAEQGLRLLGRQTFDAVISDFRMPGLNGMDLLKECAVACPDTPVVLITGYGSSALEQDALRHGAYAVLEKPVDPDVLYSVVTRAILRAEMLKRSLPSVTTPPEIHLRELTSKRNQFSARIRDISDRLEHTLGTENQS
jgi:DNA-binding NtrC family response regulator